jgi:hypothetical protein
MTTTIEPHPEVITAWNILQLGGGYDYQADMDYELDPDDEYARYQEAMYIALRDTTRDTMTIAQTIMTLNSRYIYLIERQNWRPGQLPGTNPMILCIRYKCLEFLENPTISVEFRTLLVKLLTKITLIRHAAVPPGRWGCGWDLDFMA